MKRLTLYEGAASLADIEAMIAPGKAMLAESGWIFLANDTNDFTRVQQGVLGWSEAERIRAAGVLAARQTALAAQGIDYLKFIVPEKSVLYPEHLPDLLRGIADAAWRPALCLAADVPQVVDYLADGLRLARNFGQICFRGDTHANWLGAWFIYRHICHRLADAGLIEADAAVTLARMVPELAAYDGDLTVQLPPDLRARHDRAYGDITGRYGLEVAMRLHLPEDARLAHRVAVPQVYQDCFTSRETCVYERADGQGRRAVVFRDSTLDFCHEWLAQHFSRVVFVWHQGLVYSDVIERERPDVVLHVMAERFVTRYDIWPAFATVLPAEPQAGS